MLRRDKPNAGESRNRAAGSRAGGDSSGGDNSSGEPGSGATAGAHGGKERRGYVSYSLDEAAEGLDSDRANAAGLAQLMQILGARREGASDAAPPMPPPSSDPPRGGGRVMAECVAGSSGPARGTAAQRRASRAGKGASGHQFKVPLSHLADDEADEDDAGGQMMQTSSAGKAARSRDCLLYTSPSPRDKRQSRMPSSA